MFWSLGYVSWPLLHREILTDEPWSRGPSEPRSEDVRQRGRGPGAPVSPLHRPAPPSRALTVLPRDGSRGVMVLVCKDPSVTLAWHAGTTPLAFISRPRSISMVCTPSFSTAGRLMRAGRGPTPRAPWHNSSSAPRTQTDDPRSASAAPVPLHCRGKQATGSLRLPPRRRVWRRTPLEGRRELGTLLTGF